MIRDNLAWKAEVGKDFLNEEVCYTFGGNCFSARCENYPLRQTMVDHDHYRIET